jgi:lactate permease
MEGLAGFGTAVAIPASMMISLGFDPVFSAVVCLVANSTPTAFGSIGIPTTTLSKITGIEPVSLSVATVAQLSPLILLTPFILVFLAGKSRRAFKGVGLITLISGVSFLIPEYLVARYIGPELPAVIGSVCSMACTMLAGRIFGRDDIAPEFIIAGEQKSKVSITRKAALTAWSPFILIFVFLLGTSKIIPQFNSILSSVKTSVSIYSGAGSSPYTFSWLSTPPFWIMLSAFIGGRIQGASFAVIIDVLKRSLLQMKNTIITMICIMATAKIMGYSGMISSIALMLVTITGSFYPLVAPILGMLGTFVTGSGTSSSVLFGGLQAETAAALGLEKTWVVAANTAGVAAGKMISPQSIAIAIASTGLFGKESELLYGTIGWSIVFVVIMGVIAYLGA